MLDLVSTYALLLPAQVHQAIGFWLTNNDTRANTSTIFPDNLARQPGYSDVVDSWAPHAKMRLNAAMVESNSRIRAEWQKKLASYDHDGGRRSDVEEIASGFHNGERCRAVQRFEGAFNHCFRLRFDVSDHADWLLRFPIPGDIMYPTEKIDQEVAVMEFIREETSIPIPKVIASGIAEGRFAGLGPFIIMEFIEGERLDEALYQDNKIRQEIAQSTLNLIYKQMAQIYLELFEHDFNQIGELSMSSNDRSWHVRSAPLTLKMNEGQRMTGLNLCGWNTPLYSPLSHRA